MFQTQRQPISGIILGTICAVFAAGSIWMIVAGVTSGAWIQCISSCFSGAFFLVGAVGGLLGAEWLPDKSIAELVGELEIDRALNCPVHDWFRSN